jgi:hypothetical protein
VSPAGLTTQSPPGSRAWLWGLFYAVLSPQRIARATGRAGYLVFRTLYLAFTREDPRFPDLYFQLAAATGDESGMGDLLVARLMTLRFVPAAPPGETEGGGPSGALHLASWWRAPVLGQLIELADCAAAAARTGGSGSGIGRRGGGGARWRAPLVSCVWGTHDEVLPFADWTPLLASALPGAALYRISDALHNPAHSDPSAVNASLIDCLRRGAEHAAAAAAAARPDGDAAAAPAAAENAAAAAAGAGSSGGDGGAGARLFDCVGCGAAVVQQRSLYSCACARFGFSSFGFDGAADRAHWSAFVRFLAEGRAGRFDARTSESVLLRL